ncbi:MAG: VOC family protein, partial [Microcoleaceae cyanobacterium]
DEHYVGYYHISFDLTNITNDLTAWLADLQTKWQGIMETNPQYNQPCQILLAPTQQMIGNQVYEVAFIADMDNLPLEFIRLLATIPAEN